MKRRIAAVGAIVILVVAMSAARGCRAGQGRRHRQVGVQRRDLGRRRRADLHVQAGRREADRPLRRHVRRSRSHRHGEGQRHHLLIHRRRAGHLAQGDLHRHGRQGHDEGQARHRRARRGHLHGEETVRCEVRRCEVRAVRRCGACVRLGVRVALCSVRLQPDRLRADARRCRRLQGQLLELSRRADRAHAVEGCAEGSHARGDPQRDEQRHDADAGDAAEHRRAPRRGRVSVGQAVRRCRRQHAGGEHVHDQAGGRSPTSRRSRSGTASASTRRTRAISRSPG